MNFLRLPGGAKALAQAASALLIDEGSGAPAPAASIAPVAEDPAPAADPVVEPVADPAPAPAPEPSPPAPEASGPTDGERLAHEAGRAEMHERIETVFASEHIAGREQAAAMLLSADVAADKIVAKLATLPTGSADTSMLDALRTSASATPLAPAASDDATSKRSATDNVWTKAWGLEKGVK